MNWLEAARPFGSAFTSLRSLLYACFHLASREHSEMLVCLNQTDSVMENLTKRKVSCPNQKQILTNDNRFSDADTRTASVT